MNSFLQNYSSDVIGVLSGLDRLVVRGNIRQLAYLDGMKCFMAVNRIKTQDFKQYATDATARLREAIEEPVRRQGRPVRYLESPTIDKETLVQEMVERQKLRDGTICLLSCLESCRTFEAHRDREKKTLEMRARTSKCLTYYKYLLHPELGYIHARIQTWFPFSTQVYLNGREWLARQLTAHHVDHRRADNTFVWIADLDRAQQLFDAQLRTDWLRLLEGIISDLNPLHATGWLGKFRAPYYWSVYQTEWATDVMFRSPEALQRIYPRLALHSIRTLGCRDVLRFYDRDSRRFTGDARGRLVERAEGLRVKHSADGNSVKIYDKAYAPRPGDWSVLRIEDTTTNPKGYKVFRSTENHPDGPKAWRPLRKTVADIHRLAVVSQTTNDRYAEALTAADCTDRVGELTSNFTRSIVHEGRRVRGLRPWDDADLRLLRAVNDGDWLLNGFRNRDFRARLFASDPKDPAEGRRRSAKVSRLIRILRAHGLIKKIPKSHRYQVTTFGRRAISALLAAIDATTAELARLAA